LKEGDEGEIAWALTVARSHEEVKIRTTAYDALNHNIEMLNESMDLCLPARTSRDPY
jgi:hypothetical protein